ncbi:hypothetical protein C3941_11305 [Kaistia algarum]|uniref:hypothetical protein n=1 Tax=Kaistia algarum TaxID=2083279 RepID=UPI000CE814B6|nr:hypothetical protein [Kaistia algarum]MCX5514933.1 hypothetical protein [Kaistia algarum]PPE79681.1 hypothetical protein C3941_11305 [Kaistia algarum]
MIAASVLLTSSGLAAAACQGTNIEFEEKFSPPDPSWGANSDVAYAKDGKAYLKAAPNGVASWVNPAFVFDNVFACATFKVPELKEAAAGTGGMIFWYESADKYYMTAIKGDGRVGIWRYLSGRWNPVFPLAANAAVKTTPGDENTIEVALHGNTGTLFLNGTKITDFRGQPPKGGSAVGIYAESELSQSNIWEFSDVRVATFQ